MAIGDAVSLYLGTATTNYQPASGVEVQISSFVKEGTSDILAFYDGTNTVNFLDGDMTTARVFDGANSPQMQCFNVAFMLTNALYCRKPGTTDRDWIGGVQTNA